MPARTPLTRGQLCNASISVLHPIQVIIRKPDSALVGNSSVLHCIECPHFVSRKKCTMICYRSGSSFGFESWTLRLSLEQSSISNVTDLE